MRELPEVGSSLAMSQDSPHRTVASTKGLPEEGSQTASMMAACYAGSGPQRRGSPRRGASHPYRIAGLTRQVDLPKRALRIGIVSCG